MAPAWPARCLLLGPACVIADIQMPGMSGIELLGKVMASGKPCPVILATGHGGAALRERAETLGATAFLEKPFRPAQLQKAICAILDQDARE